MQATLCPHREHVACDFCPLESRWILSHAITQERVALPSAGSWCLAWDGDGFGYVVDENSISQQEVDIDEHLSLQLAETGDGRKVVLWPGEGPSRRRCFLETKQTEFEVKSISTRLGPTSQAHNCEAACFKWPRTGGFCVYFSLVSV